MYDTQARWNKIVEITDDPENILQGLRSILFLDLNVNKPKIINIAKYLFKIFQLLIWLPKKIKIPDQKRFLFIFPYNTQANLNNLIPVYKHFNHEECIIIKHELVDNTMFNKLDIILNKKDIPFYSKYSQRFLLHKCYSIYNKLYSSISLKDSVLSDIIKRNRIKYFYNILLILISRKAAQNILYLSPLKAIISTSDYFPIEFSLFSLGKSLKIKTFLIQHGIIGASYLPFTAEYFLVWSKYFVDEVLRKDITLKERIHIGGSPSFETHLSFNRLPDQKNKMKKFVILSNTQGELLYPETYQEFRKFLDTLVPNSNYEWIVKLHPSEDERFYSFYESRRLLRVLPKITSLNEALNDASVAFTLWSSAGLDAIVMGIPIVVLDLSPEVKNYAWWPKVGGGKYYSELLEIDNLLDPNYILDIVERQKSFVDNVLNNSKNASLNIKKTIRKIIDN